MNKYTPESITVRTPLDEIGSLLNVNRIPGEELRTYAERIYSTYVKRSSSTYQGLLNGINRALGVEEKDCIEVRVRSLFQGTLEDSDISYGVNYIEDNYYETGTVDGASVIAVGSKFSVANAGWVPERLRGLSLKINGESYEILSNTEDEAVVDGVLSNLVGQSYEIEIDLEVNLLTGLALRIDGKLLKIAENTNKRIYIGTSSLVELREKDFRITAYNPKVEVSASKIYLYKEYSNSSNFQLEKQVDLRRDAKYHSGLVEIMKSCYYFEIEDPLELSDRVLSLSLKKQSSEVQVTREIVPAANYFKLKEENLKEGSVIFAEASSFLNEVDKQDVFANKGNYYVEYETGSVLVNKIPSGSQTVSYIANQFPYFIKASPAIVNGMADEEIKDFLFSQVEMRVYPNAKEQFISSQPTSDMVEYIAELIAVKPQSWGE
jgi:hypothetical protein